METKTSNYEGFVAFIEPKKEKKPMYPKCLIFASIDRTSFVGLQLHTLQEEGMLVVRGGGVKDLEGCQIQTERAATHKISQNRLAGQALIFFHGYSGGIIPDL